eukprot:m.362630 g.362630  ORF g.362630 m.362630 type:complete len:171 (+) comp20719_c0_seq1:657-1169(+)
MAEVPAASKAGQNLQQQFPMLSWREIRGDGLNVASYARGAFVRNNSQAAHQQHDPHIMLRDEYAAYTGRSGWSLVAKGYFFEVQLARPFALNAIQVETYARDDRTYTLKLEVSTNLEDWFTIHDGDQPNHRGAYCYEFPEQLVRYIRIGGTSTANPYLHIVKLAAYHTLC